VLRRPWGAPVEFGAILGDGQGIELTNCANYSILTGMGEELTTPEACELTGYSQRYIWQLCQEGKVAARKVLRDWLIDRDSLLVWKERTARHPRGGPRPKNE